VILQEIISFLPNWQILYHIRGYFFGFFWKKGLSWHQNDQNWYFSQRNLSSDRQKF
jgi:hypothetical protein